MAQSNAPPDRTRTRGTAAGRVLSAYSARPESRRLPSWWEWLVISMLTKQRQWKESERAMIGRRNAAIRAPAAVLVAAAALLGLVVYDRMAAIRADGFVQALATSDSRDLPRVVAMYPTSRHRIRNLLAARLTASGADDEQRVRVLLGLVATGAPNTDELLEQLLEAESVAVIGDRQGAWGIWST